MRRSVERAKAVIAQTNQATTLLQMATQLDRIEAKLDKAPILSGVPEKVEPQWVPEKAEPEVIAEPKVMAEPEVMAEKPVFKTRVKTPVKVHSPGK